MSVILLVLGILITGAGIVTIGYGISINDTPLGSALIVAGTTAFSAGLILIGIAAAVGQLNEIARVLRGSRVPARPGRPPELSEPSALPAAAVRVAPQPAPARSPQPPKPKVEERIPEPAAGEGGAQVSASAIERLRSSLVRPERKPAPEPEAAPLAPEPIVPAPPVAAAKGTNGATPPAGVDAIEEPKKAPLDFLFRGKPREAPAEASFDSTWPKRPQRKDEQAAPKEAPRAARERPWPPDTAAAAEEPRQPAILKSGVVDGMAYTLYADGSIEAQLPQGTVRFGSIAELRAHIENNS